VICSSEQVEQPEVSEEAEDSSFPITITDALEEEVVMEEQPERAHWINRNIVLF